jgi:hypothetical protein
LNNHSVCPVCKGGGKLRYRVSSTEIEHAECYRCSGAGVIDRLDLSDEEEDEIMDLGIRPKPKAGFSIISPFDMGGKPGYDF